MNNEQRAAAARAATQQKAAEATASRLAEEKRTQSKPSNETRPTQKYGFFSGKRKG